MIEIRKATIRLGEQDYEIQEASFLNAKPWKKRLMTEVKPLFEKLSNAPNMTFEKPEDLFQLLPLAESIFIEGIETVFDLLMQYSPVLRDSREYIEAHATDRQIVAAFQEVVILADPFGVVTQMNRKIGLTTNGTSLNSQQVNGVVA